MSEGSAEKGSVGGFVRKIVHKVGSALIVEEKTPIDEITEQHVAKILVSHRGPQVESAEEAEKEHNLIWLPDLVREEGYTQLFTTKDDISKLRAKNRSVLDSLCREGALEMVVGVESEEGEQIAWREVNPKKLEEIAAGELPKSKV